MSEWVTVFAVLVVHGGCVGSADGWAWPMVVFGGCVGSADGWARPMVVVQWLCWLGRWLGSADGGGSRRRKGAEWWLVVALGCSGVLTVRIPLSLSLSLSDMHSN